MSPEEALTLYFQVQEIARDRNRDPAFRWSLLSALTWVLNNHDDVTQPAAQSHLLAIRDMIAGNEEDYQRRLRGVEEARQRQLAAEGRKDAPPRPPRPERDR